MEQHSANLELEQRSKALPSKTIPNDQKVSIVRRAGGLHTLHVGRASFTATAANGFEVVWNRARYGRGTSKGPASRNPALMF